MSLAKVPIESRLLELDRRRRALAFQPLSEATVTRLGRAGRHRVGDVVLVRPPDRRAGLDLEVAGTKLKRSDLDGRLRRRRRGETCEDQHDREAHPDSSSIALYYGRGGGFGWLRTRAGRTSVRSARGLFGAPRPAGVPDAPSARARRRTTHRYADSPRPRRSSRRRGARSSAP